MSAVELALGTALLGLLGTFLPFLLTLALVITDRVDIAPHLHFGRAFTLAATLASGVAVVWIAVAVDGSPTGVGAAIILVLWSGGWLVLADWVQAGLRSVMVEPTPAGGAS